MTNTQSQKPKKPKLTLMSKLVTDTNGVTAIEYGLIASLVAAAAITGLSTAGPTLASVFATISSRLQAVLGGL